MLGEQDIRGATCNPWIGGAVLGNLDEGIKVKGQRNPGLVWSHCIQAAIHPNATKK